MDIFRARTLHAEGKWDEAERAYRELLSHDASDWNVLQSLAILFTQQGKIEDARSLFLSAIGIPSSDANCCFNYGYFLQEQGEIDEAINYYNRALAKDSSHLKAGSSLGTLLVQSGRAEQGFQLYLRLVKRHPASSLAWNGLGIAQVSLRKVKDSIKSFKKALALDASNADAYNNLAQVRASMGNNADAALLFGKAVQIQPEHAGALLGLGDLRLTEGDGTGARDCFQKLVSINPNDANAHMGLFMSNLEWQKPLTGRRLTLRLFQEDDAGIVTTWFMDRKFSILLNRQINLRGRKEEAIRFFARSNPKDLHCPRDMQWVITRASEDSAQPVPIGLASLVDITLEHHRAEFQIGIYHRDGRSLSEGIEATLIVMKFGFERLMLNKITAFVYGYNQVAMRNLMRLGFKEEGILEEQLFDKESARHFDLYQFGLLRERYVADLHLRALTDRLAER